jgi:hypothetical protein
MTKALAAAFLSAALSLCSFGIACSALVDNGGGLIYDTDRDITWYNPDSSPMTWDQAMSWAANLAAGGVEGWRLPSALNPDGSGPAGNFNVVGSEMGHLYYIALGNKGYVAPDGTYPQPGYGLANMGPFTNLQAVNYWSETEWASFSGNAWAFGFYNGQQGWGNKTDSVHFYAMAVHGGNVGQTLRSVKGKVLSDLTKLLSETANEQDITELQEAIRHLRNSLAPALWIDGNHLKLRYGERVFYQDRVVIHHLNELLARGVPTQAFIDVLVETDHALAQNAIDDAVAAQGDLQNIVKARDVMAKAMEQTIEHYGEAWAAAVTGAK